MSTSCAGVFNALILGVLVVLTLSVTLAAGIICVQCSSMTERKSGECERDPPIAAAARCYGHSDAFCRVIRHYDKDDQMIGLIRDCATADMNACSDTSEPVPEDTPAKVCYDTCSTDRCNSSRRISGPSLLFLLLLLPATILL